MKKLTLKSKVLNISHGDLDGVGCSIILGNAFPSNNIQFYSVNYNQIDNVLKNLHYELYDHVILTDIAPNDSKNIDISDKIVLLDHHDSSLDMQNDNNLRIVRPGECGTKLVKSFCENFFGRDLSYLDEITEVINGYDMWIHDDPRSKELNELFYWYWPEKFRKRFFNGDLNFTKEEKKYIKSKKELFKKLWKDLEVFEIESINGCFIEAKDMINDLCEKLLVDEGFEFVFCRNMHSKSISVRSKVSEDNKVHLGDLFKEMKIGGGHKNAAGIDSFVTIEELPKVLQNVEDRIIKILKEK